MSLRNNIIKLYASINENNDTIIFDINKLLGTDIDYAYFSFSTNVNEHIINGDEEQYEYIKEHYYVNGCKFKEIINHNYTYIWNNYKDIDKVIVIHCDEFNPKYSFELYFFVYWEYNKDSDIKNNVQNFQIWIQHTSVAQTLNLYTNTGIDNTNKNSAFSLLRTNPKLTGNIKLVVSDDTLYLDTFKYKTASALSNIQYCHKTVSDSGDYASDIFRIFGLLDSTTLMDVDSGCYNGNTIYTIVSNLYNTTYEYGCEANNDSLYSEEFKLLAPLHIGTNMPDYFIVFALPVTNTINITDDNLSEVKTLIQSGRVVKIFDLKESSNVGSYIRTYADKLNNYSLHNIYYSGYKKTFLMHSDTIFGIDYKYGTFTTKYNKTPDSSLSIEALNTYYIDSFKNNNLIYPWILNLEFMFNDTEGDDFSVYNYYGFYVSENEYQHISKIIKYRNSITKIQQYYDDNNKLIDINSVLNNSINKYNNALFSISDSKECCILKSSSDFYSFIKNNVINKADKLIDSPRVSLIKFNNISSFITIKFGQQIKAGEHFRIIAYNPGQAGLGSTVYDIIASNDGNLRRYTIPISQYVVTNKIKNCNVYSISFYVNDTENPEELASLSDQLYRIKECIKTIDAFFSVQYNSDDSLSITSLEEHVIFQHILAPYDNNLEYDHIHYFNCKKNTSIVNIKKFSDFYYLPYNNPIYDTNEERYSSMVKFIETKSFDNYQLYEFKDEIDEEINNSTTPVYLTLNGEYTPLSNINIIDNKMLAEYDDIDDLYIIPESTYVFVSPYTKNKHFIALSETPFITKNSLLSIYNSMECQLNVLSFLNVKDFDFLIDDPRTNSYEMTNTLTFNSGEIIPDDNTVLKKYVLYKIDKGGFYNIDLNPGNTFFIGYNHYVYFLNKGYKTRLNSYTHSAYLEDGYFNVNSETIISIADNISDDLYSYSNEQSGMSSNKFFKSYDSTLSITNNPKISSLLISPIVPATVCNWEISGTSVDNNSIIGTGDYSTYDLNNINGTFYDTCAIQDLISVDDKIIYDNETLTVRELLYKHPEQLRLLYKNVPTACVHYNETSYSIEFTYNNMLFSISLIDETNNVSIADYVLVNAFNNMEIAVINDYNASLPNELFISESDRFILLVNHNYFTYADYKGSSNMKFISAADIYNVNYFWTKTPFHYSLIDSYTAANIYKFPVIFDNESYNTFDDIMDNQPKTYKGLKPVYVLIGYPETKNSISSTDPGIYFQTLYESDSIKYNDHTGYYADCNINYSLICDDLYINEDNIQGLEMNVARADSLYNFFNKAANYDSNNIESINTTNLNDGIEAYDVISKYDNRNYMSYIVSMNLDKTEDHTANDIIRWTNSIYSNPMIGYVLNSNGYKIINSDNISINVTSPNENNKFPNFYIKPSFIDRLSFNANTEISKTLDIDLTNSGVFPSKIAHINAYPHNVINLGAKTVRLGKKNFAFTKKNIIINTWLNNMFNNKLYVNSILNNISNMKSFFGSCCINIPEDDTLEISINSNITSATLSLVTNTSSLTSNDKIIGTSKSLKTYTYKVNLTDAFVNYIIGLSSFNNNWSILTASNNKSALSNALIATFVKTYILPYYDLTSAVPTIAGYAMTVSKSAITTVKLLDDSNVISLAITKIDNNKVSITKASNDDIMMTVTFTATKPVYITVNVSIPKN